MAAKKNYTVGQRFNSLVFLEEIGPVGGKRRAKFLCDCGREHISDIGHVTAGRTTSCNCRRIGNLKAGTRTTHGKSEHGNRTYKSWCHMRDRCRNPNSKRYADYGGRGITVCDRWDSFENFLSDMGERPDGKTLDRYPDVNGNYEPGNCRWATTKQQANNVRRSVFLEFDGRRMTASEWGEEIGICQKLIRQRIKSGWTAEQALTIKPIVGQKIKID